MKLLSFLQTQGISRRKITALIDQGKIFVNGEKIASYTCEVNQGDEIKWGDESKKFDGDACNASVQEGSSHFLLFHKPVGYVCSKADPHNQIIYELLPPEYKNRYYLGRLDKDSCGLLVLTDDPKFVDQYEHPRHGVTKEYIITISRDFRKDDIQLCLDGIMDDGDLLKCVEIASEGPIIRIVLNEGKKRHIRRMLHSLHYHILELKRVREGNYILGELKSGEWKLAF